MSSCMHLIEPVRSRRWLSVVCVLLSIHFSIAYATLTKPMISFHAYRSLSGGGPFSYRMLVALVWRACCLLVAPLHARFPSLRMPVLNPPFTTNEDWFVVILTFVSMLGTLA